MFHHSNKAQSTPSTNPLSAVPELGNFDAHALHRSLREAADIKFALEQATIVAITNPHGVITYTNDAFCAISQYSREELLGQTHRIVNSGYHPPEFFKTLWETITAGRVWKGEIQNKAKDGSLYWVDTAIVPFLDSAGKPYQYVAIRHEITNLKRGEAEIRLLNRELEQRVMERTEDLARANQGLSDALNRLKESEIRRNTFLSALTHDLRTPLVAQKRALLLFQSYKTQLPHKLLTLAELLLTSNEDLLNMVNLLLESSQYESGRVQLVFDKVEVYELVAQCLRELTPLAEQKAIRFYNDIPKDLPAITGDFQQLKRVFINLIGNALENSPTGSTIRLEAEVRETELEVRVSDNGPGIPEALLPQLFERYFLWERQQTKIGTGLGLYICRMIMENHHGDIRVESRPEQGTCFYLTFPLLTVPKRPPNPLDLKTMDCEP